MGGKACNFKYEENVDRMLACIGKLTPRDPAGKPVAGRGLSKVLAGARGEISS